MSEWQWSAEGLRPTLHAVSVTCKDPKAVLVFHHGYGEHTGRYAHMFRDLLSNGIDTHSYDMRSSGRSETTMGERCKYTSFEVLVDDLLHFCDHVQSRQYKERRVQFFLSGQSLGGLVAASAVAREQSSFAGLLLFSPLLDVEMTPVLKVQNALGGPLSALFPWSRMVPAVRVEDMSEDPQVRKDYVADPLNFVGNVRVRSARQFQAGMRALKKHYSAFTLPIYGVHGSQDRCTSFKAHQVFMDAVSSSDKTLKVIEGGYHELLLGPQKEEVLQSMVDWILAHA